MSRQPARTELRDPQTEGLDLLESVALVDLLIQAQTRAVDAVRSCSQPIAETVEVVVARLRDGGNLHYVGAGTSGRLAFLDASECPPTFGTPQELVCAHIAGGPVALTRAVEGAEDNPQAGEVEMREHVSAKDIVVGISASGAAPYVLGAVSAARAAGAWTVAVVNNEGSKLEAVAQKTIVMATGPEPLAGSTRLLAGTAQKLLLNALSTATMVRLGKVYDNLMIDVVATNEKLRLRSLRLVMQLTGGDEKESDRVLHEAGGRVKVAVVMARRGVSAREAQELLSEHSGFLRAVLEV
ncbi:MAG: N-acetylmuramic acid 6-phosphate etherase [Candidatus Eremiobacteraeota bacterium]|nr:N-acetylmuramic acid 6-phosphate etherase [Candidatus Eremiobacteraeota bacterium]